MKFFDCIKLHVAVLAILFLNLLPVFGQGKSPDISGIDFESVDTYVEYNSAKVFGKLRILNHPERITGITVRYGLAMDDLSHNEKASFDLLNGFSVILSPLEDGVMYYYTVDIIVGQKRIESGIKYFFTFTKGPVDLDLPSGNKWASHNVGATLPTENGEYFAWGETSPKTLYTWPTYKYCTEYSPSRTLFSKYTTRKDKSAQSIADNKVTLEPEDDAAYMNMGVSWLTPSTKDWKELTEHCIIKSIRINEVNGFLISSKKEPNNYKKCIFISSDSGCITGTEWQPGLYYWSSNLAVQLYSSDEGVFIFSTNNAPSVKQRYMGLNVRAVCRPL